MKLVLLFPGQGSQYVGMGKNLYENYESARKVFDEANEVLGFDMLNMMFGGDINDLTKTENTQPALLTVGVAAYQVYMQEVGIKPEIMAGHSLGEITALCCSGAISYGDALKIVRERGKLMQEASGEGTGAMAAITGIDKYAIENVCANISNGHQVVVVSNYNSKEQTVISGHKEAVLKAQEELAELGARVIPLKVSAPFHSPLMESASVKLKEYLLKFSFADMDCPVLSNVTGMPYPDSNVIPDYLANQMVEAVRWSETMEYINNAGIMKGAELGPQTVLKNLFRKSYKDIEIFSFDNIEEIEKMKGIKNPESQIPNKNKLDFIIRCLAISVCTRNSNWDNEEYSKGVIEPYRKINQMLLSLEEANKVPTLEQMKEALDMLNSVFETKRTPLEESRERFKQLLDETGTESLFTGLIS